MLLEPVRLIIWDLDETFWSGTLTEGGITFIPEHAEIVRELARRGIVSTICSKNDRAATMAVLETHGIAQYFVMPSISWEPKGPRIRALIESFMLRPPTVLFIDDNVTNLHEALRFVPNIQVRCQTEIPNLLADPLLKGKDDSALARLAQYQLLDHRNRNQGNSGADVADFLRSSEIRVVIDHDIEANLDRAIELINRTNQMNFTKRRLPEDIHEARKELLKLVSGYSIQTGLIRVYDRYGDYGYCGLYVEEKTLHAGSGLIHYCFSCRILGMHVETWLFRRLGRPNIRIVGEVVSDIKDDNLVIDWIRVGGMVGIHGVKEAPARVNFSTVPRIIVRGGCELMPVSHYLNLITSSVVGEFAFNRDHIQIRIEHSLMLRHALAGLSEDEMEAAKRLGFRTEDFATSLSTEFAAPQVWLLSFWADAQVAIYRHRATGLRLPFNAYPALQNAERDLTKADSSEIHEGFLGHWIVNALEALKREYVFEGIIGEALLKETLTTLLDRLPRNAIAFILNSKEWFINESGKRTEIEPRMDINKWICDVAANRPRVTVLNINDYVLDQPYHHTDASHFDRSVYFRLYEDVINRISTWQ